MNEIKISRGDTDSYQVLVANRNTGDVFDLTGYTMRLTVKVNPNQSDDDAVMGPLTATIDTPASGIGVFTFTESGTDIVEGKYYYDVQISNGTNVHTVVPTSKSFTVLPDTTKTT